MANNYFSNLSGKIQQYAVDENIGRKQPVYKRIKKAFYLPLAIIVIAVVVLVAFLINGSQSAPGNVLGAKDERVEVEKAKAVQQLNKTFNFPLKDDKGKEVSKIKYEVLNAELRDEIIVKGKRATAIKGRMFLILNLRITNSYKSTITINTRDYVRLTIGGSSEKLAPEIHNDPVEIQADSTKYTRIGFPINDSDKELTLIVGEINGEKQTIKLTLNQ